MALRKSQPCRSPSQEAPLIAALSSTRLSSLSATRSSTSTAIHYRPFATSYLAQPSQSPSTLLIALSSCCSMYYSTLPVSPLRRGCLLKYLLALAKSRVLASSTSSLNYSRTYSSADWISLMNEAIYPRYTCALKQSLPLVLPKQEQMRSLGWSPCAASTITCRLRKSRQGSFSSCIWLVTQGIQSTSQSAERSESPRCQISRAMWRKVLQLPLMRSSLSPSLCQNSWNASTLWRLSRAILLATRIIDKFIHRSFSTVSSDFITFTFTSSFYRHSPLITLSCLVNTPTPCSLSCLNSPSYRSPFSNTCTPFPLKLPLSHSPSYSRLPSARNNTPTPCCSPFKNWPSYLDPSFQKKMPLPLRLPFANSPSYLRASLLSSFQKQTPLPFFLSSWKSPEQMSPLRKYSVPLPSRCPFLNKPSTTLPLVLQQTTPLPCGLPALTSPMQARSSFSTKDTASLKSLRVGMATGERGFCTSRLFSMYSVILSNYQESRSRLYSRSLRYSLSLNITWFSLFSVRMRLPGLSLPIIVASPSLKDSMLSKPQVSRRSSSASSKSCASLTWCSWLSAVTKFLTCALTRSWKSETTLSRPSQHSTTESMASAHSFLRSARLTEVNSSARWAMNSWTQSESCPLCALLRVRHSEQMSPCCLQPASTQTRFGTCEWQAHPYPPMNSPNRCSNCSRTDIKIIMLVLLLWGQTSSFSYSLKLNPRQQVCVREYIGEMEPVMINIFEEAKAEDLDILISNQNNETLIQKNKTSSLFYEGFVDKEGLYQYCLTNVAYAERSVHVEVNKGLDLHDSNVLPSLVENDRVAQLLEELEETVRLSGNMMDARHLYYEVSEEIISSTSYKVFGVSAVILLLIAVLNYSQYSHLSKLLRDRKLI